MIERPSFDGKRIACDMLDACRDDAVRAILTASHGAADQHNATRGEMLAACAQMVGQQIASLPPAEPGHAMMAGFQHMVAAVVLHLRSQPHPAGHA